ncbi:MAG: FIST C-terminal domain-containing protein [Candidatus Omnitrophica bacterium]|nr:FIST C-terminal domain-containing protein [Candidatus Omnitrophota bacterium]
MGTKFVTGLARDEISYEAGKKAAETALKKMGSGKVNLSIVFSSYKYDHSEVIRGVREVTKDAPLVGCSSAEEFTEEEVGRDGVACALISSETHKFFTGSGVGIRNDETSCLIEASNGFPSGVEGYPYKSYILCEDGLSGKGEETAITMLGVLGADMKLAGGSASDDLKMEKTFTFTDGVVLENSISLALIVSKHPVIIAVNHGHMPISGPLTVTRSELNIVHEIDGKPAFDVWKKCAREDAKRNLGIDVDKIQAGSADLARLLTRYEAGLHVGGENYKIRWPGLTSVVDGPMTFATSVPEGTILRVMASPENDQIASARKSAETIMANLKGRKLAGVIVFDCVVRKIILKDNFKEAVNAIKETVKVPLIGFETYGEYAMEMGQMTGFHNATTVIMAFTE